MTHRVEVGCEIDTGVPGTQTGPIYRTFYLDLLSGAGVTARIELPVAEENFACVTADLQRNKYLQFCRQQFLVDHLFEHKNKTNPLTVQTVNKGHKL